MSDVNGKSFMAIGAYARPQPGELFTLHDDLYRPPARPLYRVTVWLCAIILLVLTLAYAALALAAAWIGIDYLISHIRLLATGEPAGEVILYIALAVVGLLGLFFFLLPAFQREPAGPAPITLDRREQPLLFDFVERLCRNLNLQPPDQIKLILGTTASASLDGFSAGLLSGKTVLTLGLTLTAGVSIQQFSGILAHELGHFAQHREMRLQWIIHSINHWFARVIYSRGRVDYWLYRLSQPGLGPLRLPFYAARGSVWLGRAVLWVFMWLAHGASCLISRQAELESDQQLARAAGSDGVRSILQHLLLLDIATDTALGDLEGTWRERRLADNIPALAVDRAQRLTDEQRTQIIDILRAQKTRWFDTHPCLVDRIRAGQGSTFPGMVRDARPASLLFTDFEKLCHRATVDFYTNILTDTFTPASLVPAQTLIDEYAQTAAAHDSLRRYFQGEALMIRPVFPADGADEEPENVDAALDVLEKARNRMAKSTSAYNEASMRYVNADDQLTQSFQIAALSELGMQGLPPESALAEARRQTNNDHRAAERDLASFDEPIRTRQQAALSLLRAPSLAYRFEKLDRAAMIQRVDSLLIVCDPIAQAMPYVREIAHHTATLFAILRVIDFDASRGKARSTILTRAQQLVTAMGKVRETLSPVPYPFDHQTKTISAGEYVVEKIPDVANPVIVAFEAVEVLRRADSLISRTLAHLALQSEQVETALGFAMLNPPPQIDPMAALGTEIEEAARHRPATTTVGGLAQLAMAAIVALMIGAGVSAAKQAGSALPSVIPRHSHYQPTITSTQWYQNQPPVWQTQHPGMPGYPGAPRPGQASHHNDPRYPGYDPTKPTQYYPPGQTPQPGYPGQPGYQPGQPSRPGQPGYQPNNPQRPSNPWATPSTPRPSNPAPYRPSSPSSPSRPSPGGPGPGR